MQSKGKQKDSGGSRGDPEAARSDLALKNYQSEDTVARMHSSAQKKSRERGRKADENVINGRSRSHEAEQHEVHIQKKQGLFKRMFGLSKNDQKLRKKMSTEAVKLPKNFAEQVLDLELLINSGNFDIDAVNKLMKLYSNAVEYYSGMNDVRYV